MQHDVELWKNKNSLSEEERHMILWNLGFFSTAESLTANNLIMAVYRNVPNPEARQYILRQAYEEAVHTDTFIYSCDTLALDPEIIYNMYRDIPSIKAKDDFVVNMTTAISNPDFTVHDSESIQKFVRDLLGFYVIMEGIFFYAGFAMMLSMLRHHKMVGIGEQFQFILRDESVHLAFGADLINTIVAENPEIWTPEFRKTMTEDLMHGVELEKRYVDDTLRRGIVGLVPSVVKQYIEHIADRRLERIGLKPQFHSENPFPWMSEIIDLPKEKNFFETRVTEYKTGQLGW